MSIKALVVGVSEYHYNNNSNLPFCKNDIKAISKSLMKGLNVKKENIFILGSDGIVTRSSFVSKLFKMINCVKANDTFILYFSGHGGNIDGKNHYLLLTDKEIKTEEVVKDLDCIPSKNKLIVLDTCYSGNVKVDEAAPLKTGKNIDSFLDKGYAIISSSSSTQSSYPYENSSISAFTKFFCEAVEDKTIIKKGEKSLNDIMNLVRFYFDWWNKQVNRTKIQNPSFHSNIKGTITFPISNYIPYHPKKYREETKDYIIYSVEPISTGSLKRLRVKIIVKKFPHFFKIADLTNEIVNKVKNLDIFNSSSSEYLWKNKKANVVFCFFGRDEQDMMYQNFFCHTVWKDKAKNKKLQKINFGVEKEINNIGFAFNDNYLILKDFQNKNTEKDCLLLKKQRTITYKLIDQAESFISTYNEFLNKNITRQDLVKHINQIGSKINDLYIEDGNLPLSSKKLNNWYQECKNLAAIIDDFRLVFIDDDFERKPLKDLEFNMNNVIDRYYQKLKELEKEEKKIFT
ncbi:caspase family protein [Lactobacillus apis]|uniref:caspase family protein n=1 Tax=Lactobacillus apis TaxID=303541 RepID=UPI0016507024|nr:caspase family protein [Lactobacillus apis]MBC6361613.1 caspase family protein [Lactobacillus apis]